jgi:hypothetical protein
VHDARAAAFRDVAIGEDDECATFLGLREVIEQRFVLEACDSMRLARRHATARGARPHPSTQIPSSSAESRTHRCCARARTISVSRSVRGLQSSRGRKDAGERSGRGPTHLTAPSSCFSSALSSAAAAPFLSLPPPFLALFLAPGMLVSTAAAAGANPSTGSKQGRAPRPTGMLLGALVHGREASLAQDVLVRCLLVLHQHVGVVGVDAKRQVRRLRGATARMRASRRGDHPALPHAPASRAWWSMPAWRRRGTYRRAAGR